MEPSAATDVAALAGGLGAALVGLAATRVWLLAGVAVLTGAEIALGLLLLSPTEEDALTSHPLGLILGAAIVAGLAAVFARRPEVAPVALLAAAPFRIPLDVGGDRVYLLFPLYAVLLAAGAALCYRAARGVDLPRPPLLLAGPAAAYVALASLSMLWAIDAHSASTDLVFFYLPFMALFGILARTTLTSWTRAGLAWTLLALASLFALVGLSQLFTDDMYFAPDVEVANAYTSFTRVTSLFHDPSIYGRHLAVAIAVAVVLLWFKRIRLAVAIPLIALIWTGLFISYSQSSMFALFVTVLVVSLLAADRRSRRILVGAALVAAVAVTVVVVAFAWNHSLRDVTSGRSDLVVNTARVVAAHPIAGVGIGGEAEASHKEGKKHGILAKPSHTTPLTVAAELGPVGIVAYLIFLGATLLALVRLAVHDRPLAFALGAALLVIFVHSLFYSGFFEDPLMWGSLGLCATALAAVTVPSTETRSRFGVLRRPRTPDSPPAQA
jgi:putative inorganic carbon (HCO3(-)) transporter